MLSPLVVLWTLAVVMLVITICYAAQWYGVGDLNTTGFCSMHDVSYGECVLMSKMQILNHDALLDHAIAFGAGAAVAFLSAFVSTIVQLGRR